MKCYGTLRTIVTNEARSNGAAKHVIVNTLRLKQIGI